MAIFKGAAVAIVTPFLDNGEINYPKLSELLDYQIENGTDAIVICGTTGESSTLSHEEHLEAIRFTVEHVKKRVPVIAGTGSNCTETAIYLSREAEKYGADALLVVTPYYNKATQKGLIAHYTAVAESVSLPIIMYNVPSRTGCNIQPETAVALAKNVKNIVGIKEATADLIHVSDLVEQCPEGFQILSGDDFTVLPHIAVGGCGVISVTANVAPKLMADLCKATLAGDMDEARRLHFKLMPINRAMFLETNPIPVKTAVCMMRGLDLEFRLPMVPLMPDNLENLTKILNDCDLLH